MADLTPKIISELPEDTSLSGIELFVVMDGAAYKKMSLDTLRNQFAMNATGTALEAGSDLDALTSPATYICYGSREYLGTRPTANTTVKLFVTRFYTDSGVSYCLQIAYEIGQSMNEYRRYHNSTGWTSWVKSCAADINTALSALGNGNFAFRKIAVDPSAEDGVNVELPSNKSNLICFSSRSQSNVGLYACPRNSSGDVFVRAIVESPNLTLTATDAGINIKATNSNAYFAYGLLISY